MREAIDCSRGEISSGWGAFVHFLRGQCVIDHEALEQKLLALFSEWERSGSDGPWRERLTKEMRLLLLLRFAAIEARFPREEDLYEYRDDFEYHFQRIIPNERFENGPVLHAGDFEELTARAKGYAVGERTPSFRIRPQLYKGQVKVKDGQAFGLGDPVSSVNTMWGIEDSTVLRYETPSIEWSLQQWMDSESVRHEQQPLSRTVDPVDELVSREVMPPGSPLTSHDSKSLGAES